MSTLKGEKQNAHSINNKSKEKYLLKRCGKISVLDTYWRHK
jgi:TfoX/Sxy family transcriptional regulator of competence genes